MIRASDGRRHRQLEAHGDISSQHDVVDPAGLPQDAPLVARHAGPRQVLPVHHVRRRGRPRRGRSLREVLDSARGVARLGDLLAEPLEQRWRAAELIAQRQPATAPWPGCSPKTMVPSRRR